MSSHEIIDGSIRNEIALQRYIKREVRLMLELFEDYDVKLARLIRAMYREKMQIGSPQYKAMISAVAALRAELLGKAKKKVQLVLSEVSEVEHKKEWELLLAALLLKSNMPRPPSTTEALKEPFSSGASSASTLGVWLSALSAVDFARIRDALTLGVSQSDSVDLAVARVVGTKDKKFRDGVVAFSRNNIRALTATAIAHVVQFFRAHLWSNTPGVVGMMWTAILDTRTTAICRARDNKVVMFGSTPPPDGASLLIPQGARPPAHPNCRSRMVALQKGAMPTRETFDEFLRAQTVENQNKILGDTKAGMFRRGEVALDGFVDDTGQEFTIKQLETA